MSGRFVTTQVSFYTDPDLDDWSVSALWLYRYLYENSHVNGVSGIGRIRLATILVETRLAKEQFEQAKDEIGDRVRWYADGTYWVVGRIKHTCIRANGEENPKLVAALGNCLDSVSEELRRDVLCKYPMNTLSERYRNFPPEAVSEAVTDPQTVTVNPPIVPQHNGGNQREDCERGGTGDIDEFWGNGSWGVIEALAAKGHLHAGYPSAMKRRLNDLIPWPFKDCVAHFVDVFKAREKPKDMSEVFGRVFWRLNNAKSPSMKNRRVVERFMRH